MFGCFTCLPSICTFTCVSISIFTIYVLFMASTLSNVLIPGGIAGFTIDETTRTFDPFWKEGQLLEAQVYLSNRAAPVSYRELETMPSLIHFAELRTNLLTAGPSSDASASSSETNDKQLVLHKKNKIKLQSSDSVLLWDTTGVTFDWEETSIAKQDVNLTEMNTPPKLWSAALKGNPLYVHAYIGHQGRKRRAVTDHKFVLSRTKTSKMTTKKAVLPTWRLFPAFCDICGDSDAPTGPPDVLPASAIRNAPARPHWKPRAAFRVVVDFTKFPTNEIPPLMQPHLKVNRQGKYLPFAFADEVGLTTDQLMELNKTKEVSAVSIKYK